MDFALLGGLVAFVSRRCGLQGRLGVTRYAIAAPREAPPRKPLRVAFASDFHAGPTTDPRIFADLFHALEAEAPDVLLLGGDFVTCRARYVAALADGLTRCNPPLGKFAVLGNHDLWADHAHIGRVLADSGIDVLINRSVTLPVPYDSISICGMDDPWTGAPDAGRTFRDATAIRVFLTHSPDGLLLLAGARFEVGFSGHTHGGQVALPDGRPIIVPHGPLCRTHAYGRFDIPGNGSMIVSRGVGCSGIPLRINADPELVMCTIS